MSWRAVEMQVALPRTQDVGKIQEQMQQRGQHFQESLASSQQLSEEKKRKQVNDFEQKEQVRNKKEEKSGHYHSSNDEEISSGPIESYLDHPYLGKRIDFNG